METMGFCERVINPSTMTENIKFLSKNKGFDANFQFLIFKVTENIEFIGFLSDLKAYLKIEEKVFFLRRKVTYTTEKIIY